MMVTDHRDRESQEVARFGFVYVLKNDAMPGAVKIGQTERHPFVRAHELSQHTGVPSPFRVVCFWEVTDRIAAEQRIKAALADHQLNAAREFYSVWESEAERIIEEAIAEFIVCNSRRPPTAQSMVASSDEGMKSVGWSEPRLSKTCPVCGWRRSMCTCR